MVTKFIEVQATTGQAGLTVSAYPIGTDTVATECSAVALTEATNRLGWYVGSCDDLAVGDYQIKVLTSGGVLAGSWMARMGAEAATYQAHESLPSIDPLAYALTILAGALANPGTANETFTYTFNGTAYTVTYAGLTSAGLRGTTVLSKV